MEQKIKNYLKNKSLLITGGTGYFGMEMTNYLLKNHKPSKIIIFSRDEQKQFLLSKKINSKKIRFYLGDVEIRKD